MSAHVRLLTQGKRAKKGKNSEGRGAEEIVLALPRAEIIYSSLTGAMVTVLKILVTQKA